MEKHAQSSRKLLKLALIGYGKMGQMVEKAALLSGHQIVAKIDSKKPLNEKHLEKADVCIDFTHPKVIVKHIEFIASLKKNLVVGTTGWNEHIPHVKKIIEREEIGLLFSPNFSIGVHLFLQVVKQAAKQFLLFPEYDVGIVESHHQQKVDMPSGTAQMIAHTIEDVQGRKKLPSISSFRCGSIPGTHTVMFDSPIDSITMTHEARNREGFALGAIKAAEWVENRKGFYQMEDMFS